MTPAPEVQPLSRRHRRLVFIMSVVSFVVVVPLLVFYAIGYRIDLSGETRNIRAVGGMYVSADADEIFIYVDDEPVEDMRIFQNAAYVQNLDAGLHQLHVQGEGIQTWVKELPVYAHFVTEAKSFNLPARTQVRLITQYRTDLDESVVDSEATTTFAFASTTNNFYATSSLATTTYKVDPEYVYLSTLFASSTEERLFLEEQKRLAAERFSFSKDSIATSASSTLLSATSTKTNDDLVAREVGGEVVVFWEGEDRNRPYYFCLTYSGPAATALAYGSHIYDDLIAEFATSTNLLDKEIWGSQMCRESIRIDRKWQSVQYFDFVPGSDHLVLMQLQDGVYVVEIDDRGWQNVQLLYPGDYLEVLVDSGSIFIKDGDYILEVYTELQA